MKYWWPMAAAVAIGHRNLPGEPGSLIEKPLPLLVMMLAGSVGGCHNRPFLVILKPC
ncbi:MAG: hypothetical protein WC369_06270 [Dehalococcoidales bacterium]